MPSCERCRIDVPARLYRRSSIASRQISKHVGLVLGYPAPAIDRLNQAASKAQNFVKSFTTPLEPRPNLRNTNPNPELQFLGGRVRFVRPRLCSASLAICCEAFADVIGLFGAFFGTATASHFDLSLLQLSSALPYFPVTPHVEFIKY